MNASVAVRSVQPWSWRAPPSPYPHTLSGFSSAEIQLKELLKQAGVSVTQVTAMTTRLYGRSSPFFIPATFLYKVKAGISPNLCQLAALSRVTGVSFWECMQACGLDAGLISRIQLQLPRHQTVLLPLPVPPKIGACYRLAKIG